MKSDWKIPKIDSIKELAQFWDEHDLADFEDELEEVTEFTFERESSIKILLPPKETETLKKIAESKGVGYADLIRQWVLERIHVS